MPDRDPSRDRGDSDDYIALCEDAMEALRRVIKMTEPGTGRMLHEAFADLKRVVHAPEPLALTARTFSDPRDEYRKAQDAKREGWTRIGAPARERMVLEALGEDRLTMRELVESMNQRVEGFTFNDTDLYALLRVMMARGEIDREPGPEYRKKPLWAYFRRTKLEGPIADLQRMLDEDAA